MPAAARIRDGSRHKSSSPISCQNASADTVRRWQCWLMSTVPISRHTHMPPVSIPRCGYLRSLGSIESFPASASRLQFVDVVGTGVRGR